MTQDDFLEDSEVSEVAEAHVAKILSLEEREATRIIKVYKRIRQDLRDRLEYMPPGTFSSQHLGGVLAQIDSAINAMSTTLRTEMDSSAQSAAEKGVEDLITELEKYEKHFSGAVVPINIDALLIATQTKNFLFNRYETSMLSYNSMLRARFTQGLTDAVVEQIPMSEVISRIGKTFLGKEWEVQRIVRTELHNIYGLGKINGMSELWGEGEGDIPDLKKALYHPNDTRTAADSLYAEKLELVVPIDEPFQYTWKGKKRTFMSPPDRPNDRSILIPYRKSWN